MVDLRKEKEAIRSRITEWVAIVKTKDAKKVVQFYATDGRFLAPHAPMAQGRAQVAAAWDGLLKLPNVSLTFGPVLIEVAHSGEMAYDVGNYSLAFDGPHGRAKDEGKYVVVWKKEDGEWKAAADILNTNLPAQ
jgi:uncharacterized protein (TIGR02246 family)